MTQGDSFESAFRYASIGMAVIGDDGLFIRANPAFCRLTGYEEAELQQMDVLSITYADDNEASRDLARKLRRGDVPSYEMEKRYIRKDGTLAWVLMSVSMVHDADGKLLHYISQAQDISARKEAEAAHRASERRYRQIAEATSDIIVLTNLNGELDYISPSVRQFDWNPDELVGTRFIDRLHPDDVKTVRKGIRRLLESGVVERLRWRARHGDAGDWRWFESHACIIADEDGKPVTILDVVRDINDQVAAAERSADARAAAEE